MSAPIGTHVPAPTVEDIERIKRGWAMTEAERAALCDLAIEALNRHLPGMRVEVAMTPADVARCQAMVDEKMDAFVNGKCAELDAEIERLRAIVDLARVHVDVSWRPEDEEDGKRFHALFRAIRDLDAVRSRP